MRKVELTVQLRMSFPEEEAIVLPEKVTEALLVALAELLRAAVAEGRVEGDAR